jgi:hypothetical protein
LSRICWKAGQRQALDHDLHAEVGHVPAVIAQHLVDQLLQGWRHRIGDAELL